MITLSELMDFDHVVRVLPGGQVIDAPDVYAPEAHAYDDEIDTSELESAGWELMAGYSGQYGYAGPWMHASEYIGGYLESDILATPGLYVAIYPAGLEDPDTWAVARRVAVTATGRGCSCSRNTDGSVTSFLCPIHADADPCLTMARVTGRRRRGTIRRGVCTTCGHEARR